MTADLLAKKARTNLVNWETPSKIVGRSPIARAVFRKNAPKLCEIRVLEFEKFRFSCSKLRSATITLFNPSCSVKPPYTWLNPKIYELGGRISTPFIIWNPARYYLGPVVCSLKEWPENSDQDHNCELNQLSEWMLLPSKPSLIKYIQPHLQHVVSEAVCIL